MIFERSKLAAIHLLASMPEEYQDAELSLASVSDQEVWLGMGWLVGKGWASYRGSYCFRFTKHGREHSARYVADHVPQQQPPVPK